MKAYHIFQQLPPETGQSIFQFLRDEEREFYKNVLVSLAGQKKLRPVFVQRKPVEQQFKWMHDTCKLRTTEEIGEHLLQIWLLKAHKDMLIDFLDAMGIEHDEDGTVEDLPETLDEEKLSEAIEKLLGKYPRQTVALYLHVFQMQQPDGWETLTQALENDERLSLSPNPDEAEKPEDSAEKEVS